MALTISRSTLVAITLFALAGCKRAETPLATTAPAVNVASVAIRQLQLWDEFNGRVAAVESVDIRPRATGHIDRIAFREGEDVRKGDVLFVIDPRPYQAALEGAQAQLERARATVQRAQQQDRRAQTLMEARATSIDEAESRRTAVQQAQADVRAAEAALAAAKLNLEYTTVRSPVDGRASRALLTRGNLAVADQSMLTSVVSTDPVYVYFDPDEHSYLRFRQALGATRARYQAQVALADEQGFPHTGTVTFIDNQVDPATGTIRARAVIPNPDRVLTPGLFARVRFAVQGASEVMLIDDRAVLTDQDRKYVYVLGPDNKAIRRDVQLGRMTDGMRVVEGGLKAGEKTIVSGFQRIYYSGASVVPTEVPMARSAQQDSAPTTANL